MEVLVNYPGLGSVWLNRAKYRGDFVVGEAWDEDHEEVVYLNFPRTCIRKVVEDANVRASKHDPAGLRASFDRSMQVIKSRSLEAGCSEQNDSGNYPFPVGRGEA